MFVFMHYYRGMSKLTLCFIFYFVLSSSVPNAVTLQLKSSNTRSITVSWADPGGMQDYFEVDCGSDSSTPDQRIYPNDSYEATCAINDASIDHTITVTAVSGDRSNPAVGIFSPGGKCVVHDDPQVKRITSRFLQRCLFVLILVFWKIVSNYLTTINTCYLNFNPLMFKHIRSLSTRQLQQFRIFTKAETNHGAHYIVS